jgi:hypothetical protein
MEELRETMQTSVKRGGLWAGSGKQEAEEPTIWCAVIIYFPSSFSPPLLLKLTMHQMRPPLRCIYRNSS